MSGYSDAWILTALLLAGDWTGLSRLIALADGLEHAIPTIDELNGALARLVPAGLAEVDSQKRLCATQAAKSFRAGAAFRRAGLHGKVEAVQGRLERLPQPVGLSQRAFFTEEELERAVTDYRSAGGSL